MNGPSDRDKKRGILGGRGPIAVATTAGAIVHSRLTTPVTPPKEDRGREVWARLSEVFGQGTRPTPGAGLPSAESMPT